MQGEIQENPILFVRLSRSRQVTTPKSRPLNQYLVNSPVERSKYSSTQFLSSRCGF